MAAENGHLNVLKLFVKRCRYWVELLNNHHQNILHVAAQNGHLKVVRYIQNMFMVNDLLNETDEDGNTPLHLAAAKLHSSILVSPSNEGNEGTDGNQAQATPNKTGCAGDEKIEAKKEKRFHLWPPLLQQRTIEILKAASAKQAKKLEGILEQEDLIIESIREKRRKEMAGTLIVMATLVATVAFSGIHPSRGHPNCYGCHLPNGTGIPYWTVHCSITLNGACYHGLFYWLSLPKSPLLAGASYSPRGICLVTRGYRRENQNQNTLILLVSLNNAGESPSTVLVLVEANDSDLLVSLNNAGESPLFMAVDARASEIMKTILQNQIPILFSIEVPKAKRFYTGPF
ncbi:hypothetical protein CK203_105425 [Vitis vinifera]|uniref:Uncharacterized protein n=1 Tax=Vitis vinifera TaxID=29760 RepID=A0A438CQK3_VITVI|nr:hypothetical protein CK203_105425 [Vitis vinifera]